MTRRLDLAVIVPDLRRLGGAERFALACIARWSGRFRTTLYSMGFAPEVEDHIGPEVVRRGLSPRPTAQEGGLDDGEAKLLYGLATPKRWGEEVGAHDLYLAHQWPAQRLGRHPLVWFAHEPRRILHDLRYEDGPDELLEELAEVRQSAGKQWDHVFDRRRRAERAALDEAESRDRPDRVVTNSQFTAGILQTLLGGRRPDVVRPGVEVAAFDPPVFDERFFLAVGRLDRHKRPQLLLEAIALAPEARLVWVGGGPLAEDCVRMAQALGVADRVELRSDVGDAELRDLFRRCRGVAFVPRREPFGMVALEAMAAGKPLICTGDGGYSEVVDASCARVVPPEPARIAEALVALQADPTLAQTLGAAGRRRAAEHSWEATAEALALILEETASRPAKTRSSLPPTRTALSTPVDAFATDRHGAPQIAVSLHLGYGEGAGREGWAALREAGWMDAPTAGYYASTLGSTLERQHVELATLAPDLVLLGIPVNADGPGLLELAAAVHHLEVAARDRTGQRFAVHARVSSGGEARLRELRRLVVSDLAESPPYARSENRPCLWVEALPGANPETLRQQIALSASVSIQVLGSALGSNGILRIPTEAGGTPWQEARIGLRDVAPRWVWLDGWNDYARALFLEPTRQEGLARLERAAAFVAELRSQGAASEGTLPGTTRASP